METNQIVTAANKVDALFASLHEVIMDRIEERRPPRALQHVSLTKAEFSAIDRLNPGLVKEIRGLASKTMVGDQRIERMRRCWHAFLTDAIREECGEKKHQQAHAARAADARREEVRREIELLGKRRVNGSPTLEQLERWLSEDREIKISQCAFLAKSASQHAAELDEAGIETGVDKTTQTEAILARWTELDKLERDLRARVATRVANRETSREAYERSQTRGKIRHECQRRGLDPKPYLEKFDRTGEFPRFERQTEEKPLTPSRIEQLAEKARQRLQKEDSADIDTDAA